MGCGDNACSATQHSHCARLLLFFDSPIKLNGSNLHELEDGIDMHCTLTNTQSNTRTHACRWSSATTYDLHFTRNDDGMCSTNATLSQSTIDMHEFKHSSECVCECGNASTPHLSETRVPCNYLVKFNQMIEAIKSQHRHTNDSI